MNNNQQPMYNQQPMPQQSKGGSKVGCIIALVIGIPLVLIILFVMFGPLIANLSQASKANYDFNDLKVYIPEEWERNDSGDSGITYANSDKTCTILLMDTANSEKIEQLTSSLKSQAPNSTVVTKSLQGHDWNVFEYSENNALFAYYWTNYNNKTYLLGVAGNNDACSQYKNDFEESIRIKNND